MVLPEHERAFTEGTILFDCPEAGKPVSTWYKLVGDLSTEFPVLITLHGGPGAGHKYLSSLLDIYDRHRIPILFYDQIGCGLSTHFREKMGDGNFWTIDLFIRELDNLIDTLGLRARGFFILGQSWGGVLAGSYASRQPIGLKKVIIASGPADLGLYAQGAQLLLNQLPEDMQRTIEDCEKRGDYSSPEYEAVSQVWAKKHLCRLDPWPQPLKDASADLRSDPTAYMTMQGPSEFRVIGSLRGWEGWSKAHLISVPTLLLNGRYDEVTDVCMKPWFQRIPRVRWVTFEEASHMSHWEARERYVEVVGEFLVD